MEAEEKPATTVAKQRAGEAPSHYLIGPLRRSQAEAEADLALWRLADELRSAFPAFLEALRRLSAPI